MDPPNGDSKEMDRNRQAQKIVYYIHNYYMDSFNNRNVHMRNCGNRNYRRTTVIDHASNDVDELPCPHPDEAFSDPTPSTGPALHPIQTNALLQTQLCHNPNVLVPPLQPVQNAVPKEIADMSLSLTNHQPRLDLRPVPSSDSSNYNAEHLEHLDSSLAPLPSIQLSGNTLADILTPHAHDLLVPSDVSIPSAKRSMSDPSLFFSIRNSEQCSSPSNSSLMFPSTSRSHYVMVFSLAVFFCLIIISLHKWVMKEYINNYVC
ncbi:hypothetical protein BYT27DRAFT_7240859 [Phlegmacium glaucopus]|nr:hypothetical protein BYT27DRAFT_7240859 [Phlegmacium glaucopus]